MKRMCRRVQRILGEGGPTALQTDAAAQQHLEGCEDCFALLEQVARLDAAFDAMPKLDAPDELVEQLLAREEFSVDPAEQVTSTVPDWRQRLIAFLGLIFGPGQPRLKASLALALLAAVSSSFYWRQMSSRDAMAPVDIDYVGFSIPESSLEPRASGDAAPQREASSVPTEAAESPEMAGELRALGYVGEESGGPSKTLEAAEQADRRVDVRPPPPEPGPSRPDPEVLLETPAPEDLSQIYEEVTVVSESPVVEVSRAVASTLTRLPPTPLDHLEFPLGAVDAVTLRGGSPRIEGDDEGPFEDSAEGEASGEQARARRFLAERDRVEGVSFQPAEGYWSNTYVPGDPVLRHLQARVSEGDRSVLGTVGGELPQVHDAARQSTQPFDPPTDAALALRLNADRKAVRGPSRVLLQVGLVGTERRGARRPEMNVALVLDLRDELQPGTASALRALMLALGEARDFGDRFRLIVAGPNGGELVALEDFKHGPLAVASRQLFSEGDVSGEPMSLVEAMRLAFERVGETDDPTAPLGSSSVLLVTARTFDEELWDLVELAHAGAVAGIPLSAVGVGADVDLTELDRLAVAGQGNRRLLEQASEARALVDRELAAVARVVARAVRLRIGLAPGVKLIDVVGARRFGAEDAERVRSAERSIDQRLARNLGIEADRGDDEPGIQIVLPAFYAGDRHVILLDLLVPGPGPVADVTARFKDLAHVGNGVARAALELRRGRPRCGPLERTVLENLLAQQLRTVLEQAGDRVDEDDPAAARQELEAHRQLLAGLGQELRGFAKDPDVVRDLAMLDEYLRLLATPTFEQRLYLADSLRYAARLKVLPAPQPMGGPK
ncbi:MAG: hypothetical protein AAF560_15850 [Acidobacteriota bacterium]